MEDDSYYRARRQAQQIVFRRFTSVPRKVTLKDTLLRGISWFAMMTATSFPRAESQPLQGDAEYVIAADEHGQVWAEATP